MRFRQNVIRDGTTETIVKFFWWPTAVWDCDLQRNVILWLESAKVVRWRLGGRWADYTLWHIGHDLYGDSYSPEAVAAFKELGVD